MSHRPKRVAEEIRRVLSEKILRGLKEPLPGFVTLSEVEVNRDFTQARIFYSVFGSDADATAVESALDRLKGMLRKEVGKKIRLRNTPELVFVRHDGPERAARIDSLLSEKGQKKQEDDDGPA
jgi:ribosome-binding factor A